MARQNDLRTREEAQLDYEGACKIADLISQIMADLRAKMLRVQQSRTESWERMCVLDREYIVRDQTKGDTNVYD